MMVGVLGMVCTLLVSFLNFTHSFSVSRFRKAMNMSIKVLRSILVLTYVKLINSVYFSYAARRQMLE